ncbi:hypothetical protein Tco_0292187 [Tanacetum coccineum]
MNETIIMSKITCYDSNSFGFDQLQTPQFPSIINLLNQWSRNALQSQEDLFEIDLKSVSKSLIVSLLGKRLSHKGVPKVCDVPFHDNSPPLDISKDQSEDFSDSNVDSTSTDEDSFSSNDVEYVEASPPNSEPVSSKVMEIVIPEVGRIEDDILLIKRFPSEKLSLSSGSPTTHSELSLPDIKAFYIDNFPLPIGRDFYHEDSPDELAQIILSNGVSIILCFKIEPELGILSHGLVGKINFQESDTKSFVGLMFCHHKLVIFHYRVSMLLLLFLSRDLPDCEDFSVLSLFMSLHPQLNVGYSISNLID